MFCNNQLIIKIGHGLKQDINELIESYPTLSSLNQVIQVIETNILHQKLNPHIVSLVSLKYLTRHYLNSNLFKYHQCSSWGSRPLSEGQINYAACDVLVLLRLYDSMTYEIEDLFGEFNIDEFVITIQQNNLKLELEDVETTEKDQNILSDSSYLSTSSLSTSSSTSISIDFNENYPQNIERVRNEKNNKRRRLENNNSNSNNRNKVSLNSSNSISDCLSSQRSNCKDQLNS